MKPSANTVRVLCSHCSQPMPRALIVPAAEQQFCCHGCQTVYQIIHQCNLDGYYRLVARDEDAAAQRRPASVTGRNFTEYDDPQFISSQARDLGGSRIQMEFCLENIHCAACAWLLEKLPSILPGVVEARLDLGKALLRVTYDSREVALSRIAQQLDRLGYTPHPARGIDARAMRTREDRRQMIQIAIAGAAAGNIMLMAFALYAGLFDGMESAYVLLFRWTSMVLGMVSLVWPGAVFFRGAWAAIRMRTPHLDIPIALGLGAGGIAGFLNTVLNRGEIYFDSLAVLVFLLLTGRFLQRRQQYESDDAVELLFSLLPMSARRVRDGVASDVPIASLLPGDIIEVRAGESIAVDGIILSGESSMNQSLLTGESRPQRASRGMPACAGTVNLSSPLQIRVSATGEQTRVGKLMQLVSECAQRKAPVVLFANRIAGWFTLAAIGLAVMTFVYWWPIVGVTAADHAIALLIVACPCALGLATPLAMAVAIGRAARREILIKGGEALEHLSQPGMLFLDKTGTLTRGQTTLISWTGDESAKPLLAAIERTSTHPVARAITTAFGELADDLIATDTQQKEAGGISGIVNGRMVLAGSCEFMRKTGGPIPNWANEAVRVCLEWGQTPVMVAIDGDISAVAGFGDALRPDAITALGQLRKMGWKVGILSGDHPEIVARVAAELDIKPADAEGGVLPEQKLQRVQAALKRGPVVMVGDGVNDAAALAAATVGIAVHGGAEASLAAADVYLNRPGLQPIVELVTASRRTVHAIRRGLLLSLGYNILAVSLAATGVINPLIAAVLMPLSSLTVLACAFSSRTFGVK